MVHLIKYFLKKISTFALITKPCPMLLKKFKIMKKKKKNLTQFGGMCEQDISIVPCWNKNTLSVDSHS